MGVCGRKIDSMAGVTYEQWLNDLENTPKAKQAYFIRNSLQSKNSLHIFGRYFFPNIIQGDDDVPESHIDLMVELASPESRGIIFPRGFAKTTWEKIDTIHDIVYALEPVILYISDTLTSAQFHFESIKTELENNQLLRSVYGNLVPLDSNKGRKWTNKHFETTNKVNVVARSRNKGRGVNIKNKRPTKAIADDIEDDESVQSAEQRTKLHNWIYNVILPSLDKERGRLKMIGTVLHSKSEVLNFYKERGGIFRQAIENGVSIWPNRYTIADLYRIRDGYTKPDGTIVKGIGTRAFMQEYMNKPTSEELAKIQLGWVDNNTFIALPDIAYEEVIYIDPQAGESGMADEFAITRLRWFRKDIHRYVMEQVAGRKSQLEQAKEVVRMWLRSGKKSKAVGVEKVLNQTAVYQTLMNWKSKRIDFNTSEMTPSHKEWIDENDRNIPIVALSPEGKDKVSRLEQHEAAFERGEIHLRPEMTDLRDQICFLGTNLIEHDDRADSLIGALDMSFRNLEIDDDDNDVLSSKKKKEYNTDKTVAGNLYKARF